jgi:hypothetical protein
MKKNILSLVAFMAFSVSAFANTVEVKEEVVEVKEEVVVNLVEKIVEKQKTDEATVDCWKVADLVEAVFNYWTGNDDQYASFPVWEAAYEACNKLTNQ